MVQIFQCYVTLGNSFFQMSSYARAYVCITYEKTKEKIPLGTSRGLKWENKTYKLKRSIGKTVDLPQVDLTIIPGENVLASES